MSVRVVGEVTRDFLGPVVWGGPPAAVEPLHESLGGKGFNTARLLASLGVPTAFSGVVGRDAREFGFPVGFADQLNVDDCFIDERRACGRYFDFGGRPYFAAGCEAGVDGDLADRLLERVRRGAGRLYVAVNRPDFARRLLLGCGRPALLSLHQVAFEPDGSLARGLLTAADGVVGNAAEIGCLADRFGPPGGWPAAFGLSLVVETRGPGGATAFTVGGEVTVESPAAEEVDPTGAGDAFAAGLLYGLVRGDELGDALRLGCRLGAECVAGWGPLARSVRTDALA